MEPPLFDPNFKPNQTRRPKSALAGGPLSGRREKSTSVHKPYPPRSPRPKSARPSPHILQELMPHQAMLVDRYLRDGPMVSYDPYPEPSGDRSVLYKVVVTTGDMCGAGTDARVYMTLHGSEGKLPRRQLSHSKTSSRVMTRYRFRAGAADTFRFRSIDVGDVTSITVQHDGTTRSQGWYLDGIDVHKTDLSGDTEQIWSFPCHSWLSLHEPHSEITRELFPRLVASTVYEIEVETGNQQGAGTDAGVYVTLFGTTGRSPMFKLSSRTGVRQVFLRGETEVFQQRSVSVGPLTKIRIQHDNSGIDPDWFLEQVVIRESGRTDWPYMFPCRRWLSRDREDGLTYLDIALAQEPLARETQRYRITTVTGGRKHAGTDANVYIELFGANGTHAKRRLRTRNENFERGRKDDFIIECLKLGQIDRIRMLHDNTGFAPAWYLEKVNVVDLKNQTTFAFPCNQWLARTKGDGHIARDLDVVDTNKPVEPLSTYNVAVYTADVKHAGTGAQVYLQMYGENRWSEETRLSTLDSHCFQRARTDSFKIECPSLGDLKYIRIRHNNTGSDPSWLLEKVTIQDKDQDVTYIFSCHTWLALDRGAREIAKQLYPDPPRPDSPEPDTTISPTPTSYPYKMTVFTGSQSDAGTTSWVTFTLFGENGVTLEVEPDIETFTRNSTKKVTADSSESLGDIQLLRVQHDNSGDSPGWYLVKVEAHDLTTGKSWKFHCHRWLAEDNGKRVLCDLLPGGRKAAEEPALFVYVLEVFTGDAQFAGTDARIYVKMYGENTESMEMRLETSQSQLEAGSSDRIEVMSPEDLGTLKRLQIRHDDSGLAPGWFLDRVIVYRKDTPDTRYEFPCYRWLAAGEDDGAIMRLLHIDTLVANYRIRIFTGDVFNAGSDANVYLILYGEHGNSGRRYLSRKGQSCFERAGVDAFELRIQKLGVLNKIQIGHDNSGVGPGWFLDKVIIEDPDTAQACAFPCSRWLSKDEDDGQVERELTVQQLSQYAVETYTGSRLGAGSDANIYIELFGENGTTGPLKLYKPNKNCFERSSKDKFKLECGSVGQLSHIRIYHDNSGAAPGWYLNKVVVKDRSRGVKHNFPCYQWLARDEDDKQISRELYPETSASMTEYRITLVTGNRRSAGTDANVYVLLYGDRADSREHKLDRNMEDNFEKGKTDTFTIECKSLGTLNTIRCRHDNSGLAPGWFLDKVLVTDIRRQTTCEFPCFRWLAKDEDDGKISRDLEVRTDAVGIYIITTVTGNEGGAGTDSNVYIEMFGTLNNCSEKQLQAPGDMFERGREDVFEVESLLLGPIKTLRIWHDNSGAFPGWYLDKVMVKDMQTNKIYEFLCDRWLARNEDDGQTSRILEVSNVIADVTTTTGVTREEDTHFFHTEHHEDGFITPRSKSDADDHLSHDTGSEVTWDDTPPGGHVVVTEAVVETSRRFAIGQKMEHIPRPPSDAAWSSSEEATPRKSKSKNSPRVKVRRFTDPLEGRYTSGAAMEDYEDTQSQSEQAIQSASLLEVYSNMGLRYSPQRAASITQLESTTEVPTVDSGNENENSESKEETDESCANESDTTESNTEMSETEESESSEMEDDHENKNTGDRLKNLLRKDTYDQMLRAVISTRVKKADTTDTVSDSDEETEEEENEVHEKVEEFKTCISLPSVASDEKNKFLTDVRLENSVVTKPETRVPLGGKKDGDFLYRVSIYTGVGANAGTDAMVYVSIFGDLDSVEDKPLVASDGGFKQGVKEDVVLSCPRLGAIKRLVVRHDNTGVAPSWFLDKIIVHDLEREVSYSFSCYRWLATDEDDGRTTRELMLDAGNSTGGTCLIHIFTSSIPLAGTNSDVWLRVYSLNNEGKSIQSDTINIKNRGDNFEQGAVDRFTVELEDIGIPYKMRVGHTNSGVCPGWHLDRVEMVQLLSRQRYVFRCGRWMARDEDDGAICREMPAEGSLIKKPKKILKYVVEVYTGDKTRAGTDANVFINVIGKQGDTGVRYLTRSLNHTNKFERAQMDEFLIQAVNIKTPKKIRIGHDGSMPGSGWFLEKVVVRRKDSEKNHAVFHCNRWLDVSEDDGMIVRELIPGNSFLNNVSYHVYIRTGDVFGAGTDANVVITLFGDECDTGPRELRQAENHRNKFERGRTDLFHIEAIDIGKVKRLTLSHDNGGPGSAWFVDDIIVEVPTKGARYVFTVNRWLEDEVNGCAVDMAPSDVAKTMKKISYAVTVWTGDIPCAGTNANVFIQLFGEYGRTRELALASRTDNFERGQVDRFKVEAEDIGPIQKIRIGHDNTTAAPGWFLEKLLIQRHPRKDSKKRESSLSKLSVNTVNEVKDVEEEVEEYWFNASRWLATDEEDGNIIIELSPKGVNQTSLLGVVPQDVNFEVLVYTGDESGAGTDANVYMTLYGENGDSGERQLKTSNNVNKFERGMRDIFSVNALHLGPLTKVLIRHDNAGMGGAWYLSRVVVKDPYTASQYLFPCEQWLANDGQGRQLAKILVPTKVTRRISDVIETETLSMEKIVLTTYHVTVTTGDCLGAGTDARVYLTLCSEKDASGRHYLTTSTKGGSTFNRGNVDEFEVTSQDIGEVTKIIIGHDDTCALPDWYLANVKVENPSTGQVWHFPCNKWLSHDLGDGLVEREILVASDMSGGGDDDGTVSSDAGLTGSHLGDSYSATESFNTKSHASSELAKMRMIDLPANKDVTSFHMEEPPKVTFIMGRSDDEDDHSLSSKASGKNAGRPNMESRISNGSGESQSGGSRASENTGGHQIVNSSGRSSLVNGDVSVQYSNKAALTSPIRADVQQSLEGHVPSGEREGSLIMPVYSNSEDGQPRTNVHDENQSINSDTRTKSSGSLTGSEKSKTLSRHSSVDSVAGRNTTRSPLSHPEDPGTDPTTRLESDGKYGTATSEGKTETESESSKNETKSESNNDIGSTDIARLVEAANRREEMMESFGRMRFRSTRTEIIKTTTTTSRNDSNNSQNGDTYDSDISNQSLSKYKIDQAQSKEESVGTAGMKVNQEAQ